MGTLLICGSCSLPDCSTHNCRLLKCQCSCVPCVQSRLRIAEKVHDPVNNPLHYTDGKIEVIDFIEDKKLGYHLGNTIKYVCRAEKKGGKDKEIEDLKKAQWYLNRRIQNLKKKV